MPYHDYKTLCPDGTEHHFEGDYFVRFGSEGHPIQCKGEIYWQRDRHCTKCAYQQWVRMTEEEYAKYEDGIPPVFMRIEPKTKPRKPIKEGKMEEETMEEEVAEVKEEVAEVKEEEDKPKRTRRSRAEMEAIRAEQPQGEDKPKRTRRSRAEMEALRAELQAEKPTEPKAEKPAEPTVVFRRRITLTA